MKYTLIISMIYCLLGLVEAFAPIKAELEVETKAEKAKKVTFWQITDIHYDSFYDEKGDEDNFCHAYGEIGNGIFVLFHSFKI